MLGRYVYRLAGLGIAPKARRPMVQGKAAKAANLHPLLLRQRIADLVEYKFY